MDSGPSTSRRASHSISPSSRHKSLRSTDVLSPDSPPTYNSLDTHDRERDNDLDTDRLLDHKGKRRSTDHEDNREEDDELRGLRIDLDAPDGVQGAEAEAARLASVEQRKALWWKNTLMTGLFICSW